MQCNSWLLEAMKIIKAILSVTLVRHLIIIHLIRELTRVIKHLEDVRCHTIIISSVWKVLVYRHSVFLSSKIV